MSEPRDLDVSAEEGEDVKGGVGSPMPPTKNPGKPVVKSPGTAIGAGTPVAVAPKSPKAPGKMPPS